MNTRKTWLSLFLVAAVALTAFSGSALKTLAQSNSQTFPQTGKTISGRFLDYWTMHGGLAQQGFPISDLMQEKSDTDGKTYTVQYFERAVFEAHPENNAPNDVLLSLLGVFFYQQKYGGAGAPGQLPNTSNGSMNFPQTGHRLGGAFLDYWQSHGGLAQQGFPISDPFVETSTTDGKQYTVQYFERAVFELHPENPAPNNVLLSLLGRFQLDRKAQSAATVPVPTAVAPATKPASTPTTAPTAAPPPPTADPNSDCSGIPASVNQTVTPVCGPGGTVFRFVARGFQGGENVGVYFTAPDQSVIGAPFQAIADGNGVVAGITLTSNPQFPGGIYALSMEGTTTHVKSIGYFKITAKAATPTPLPGSGGPPPACDTSHSVDGQAVPSSGKPGDTIVITARGFQRGEDVSFWFTTPDQRVVGTTEPAPGFVNPDGTIGPLPLPIDTDFANIGTGTWAITFQGASSQHKSVIFFCISK